MKNLRSFLLFSVCVLCLSCKVDQASFTPFIQVSYFYLNPVYLADEIVGADDTLNIVFENGVYVLDSISKTDKVTFAAAFGSYGNDLTAIRCNFDTTQLAMEAPATQSASFKQVLSPYSDFRNLQLEVNPSYNYVSFPITYRPMESGVYQFELVVESDSKFSPSSITFAQPVR